MADDNGAPDAEMVEAAEAAGGEDDFFDHEPSKQEKHEVRSLELSFVIAFASLIIIAVG
jgi:hypothetical protein